MRHPFDWGRLTPEEFYDLWNDTDFIIRLAPAWTGQAEMMPQGTRKALGKCVAISKALAGVTGTTVDRQGRVNTRKAIAQKELARTLREGQ